MMIRHFCAAISVCAALAAAESTLEISVEPVGFSIKGEKSFSPKNIGAIWIQDSTGAFIKTLRIWAKKRIKYLTEWASASDKNKADAVTSATLSSYKKMTAQWDLTGVDDAPVANGTYQYCIESTNYNGPGPYVLGEIAIDGESKTVTGAKSGKRNGTLYLKNISVVYSAPETGIYDRKTMPESRPDPNRSGRIHETLRFTLLGQCTHKRGKPGIRPFSPRIIPVQGNVAEFSGMSR